ncbi:MAG: cell division protein ZapA [Betaproteobacteria bacterium]|nr:cell division protein ZapA [Betaproteobacteria bacterium]
MNTPLKIFIRQHQFSVRCGKNEENAMRAAARAVEEKLRTVREQTKVADGERAALMAALQIAFEADGAPGAPKNTAKMLRRIDAALARTDQFLQERASNGMNQ